MKMKNVFFYWSVTGLLCEFVLNFVALFFDLDLTENISYPWLFHLSIIVLIVFLKNNKYILFQKEKLAYTKHYSSVFPNAPAWFVYTVLLSFPYFIINFILFAINTHGDPGIENGKYILSYQGKFLKAISENEYHHFKAVRLGLITAPFIVIYSILVAILWPQKSKLFNKIPTPD